MNARTRLKLEDDFPEITDALLDVLYPHYLRPVPSMAIVQFHADRTQAELAAGYTIARESPLETETIEGEPCRFRTCYPVTLWPLELSGAAHRAAVHRANRSRSVAGCGRAAAGNGQYVERVLAAGRRTSARCGSSCTDKDSMCLPYMNC